MIQQPQNLFPPFRLDPINERLMRDQEVIPLRPKSFAVLRYLAERPKRLVRKEELLVAACLEKGAMEIEEMCEEMARRHQFLREAPIVELPDGSAPARYVFMHSLYQNVLYQRMAEARRSRLRLMMSEQGGGAAISINGRTRALTPQVKLRS